MTPKLTCHLAGLDIEDHNSSIDLSRIIILDALRALALERTRPEARKSPLRLNLRQVAWPDPDRMISVCICSHSNPRPTELPCQSFWIVLGEDKGIGQRKIHD